MKNCILMIYSKIRVCLTNDVIVALKESYCARDGAHLSVKETPPSQQYHPKRSLAEKVSIPKCPCKKYKNVRIEQIDYKGKIL